MELCWCGAPARFQVTHKTCKRDTDVVCSKAHITNFMPQSAPCPIGCRRLTMIPDDGDE